METLARRVIRAREAKNLSQERLAQAVGVSAKTIHRIEAGLVKKETGHAVQAVLRFLNLQQSLPTMLMTQRGMMLAIDASADRAATIASLTADDVMSWIDDASTEDVREIREHADAKLKAAGDAPATLGSIGPATPKRGPDLRKPAARTVGPHKGVNRKIDRGGPK